MSRTMARPVGVGQNILYGKKVCRYIWHSAGSLGWPFLMLKYKYIFPIRYRKQFYQTALENCYSLKLLKISEKMLIAVKVKKINLLCYLL